MMKKRSSNHFTLKISGGLVCDGTGEPCIERDIGIIDDRIAAIGDLARYTADKEIDGRHLVAAPGFIDIHSHTDETILINPRSESKVRQGVTTEVAGNCGCSPAPLYGEFLEDYRAESEQRYNLDICWQTVGEYFSTVEHQGTGVNYAMLVGNGNLRGKVSGFRNRPLSRQDRDDMKCCLAESMEDGAWGLSSGLIYAPSSFADVAELAELAGIIKEYGGMYATHMRGEGETLLEAIDEAVEVAERSGAVLEVSHMKAARKKNWEKLDTALATLENAALRLKAGCDVYPYAASSTGLDSVLPGWLNDEGKDMFLRHLGDPEIRKKIAEELEHEKAVEWSEVMISSLQRKNESTIVGRRITEAAQSAGKTPLDLTLDLLIENEGNVAAIFFTQSEENVRKVLAHPLAVIGSDATARIPHGPLAADLPHPRAYGTYPRVLGYYVREQKLIPLEEAVRKMTLMPALRLGLPYRGALREGYFADIVLFDPCTIKDCSTYIDPHRYPEGIPTVVVNGRTAVEDGEHTGVLAGRVLRSGAERK
ncbi:MAG: amidohydrolase family protein [Candidatus Xenobiia bacterium LiM19]